MSLISLKKLKHIENLKWLLVDSILSYFRHCEPCQPDDKYTFPHQVNAMSPFETCEGDCLQTDHAEKATCREVCHLVTQDNHRSLSSIWHFATPIFPGLHLDSPWILRGWVRRYTHHWNSEENLRAGLSPRHFSPPVHCSSTKDNYHRWDTLQRQHFQRTCPFACKANCATVIPHTKPDKKRACEQVCHLVILHLLFIHKKTQAQSPIYDVSARTIFSGLSG